MNPFAILKHPSAFLPVAMSLGAHGDYFDLATKYARLKQGGRMPFIDPDGYKMYVAEKEHAFRTELAKQSAGRPGRTRYQ